MPQERLWATWRMPYISGVEKKDDGCIFCDKPKQDKDAENFILHRGKRTFAIMNLYPYNNGHIMIIPYKHTCDICELDDEESLEIMDMARFFTHIIKEVMHPEGFNVGFNVGRPAGAGIAGHIHMHIVPRWTGDTNFMPVIAETRVISEHIRETYNKLLNALKKEVK